MSRRKKVETKTMTIHSSGRRRRRLVLLISEVLVITALVTGLLCVVLVPYFRVKGFAERVKVPYGADYVDEEMKVCYGNMFACEPIEVTVEGAVDTGTLGEYELIYNAVNSEGAVLTLKKVVSVVDEEPPVITAEVERVQVCPNGKIPAFEFGVQDNYDGDIKDWAEVARVGEEVVIRAQDSSGNEAWRAIGSVMGDSAPPEVVLNGTNYLTLVVGMPYEEAGATAVDNCDEVEVQTSGTIDTGRLGDFAVTYMATDQSGNTASIARTVRVVNNRGIIYLTFDDGPGPYTAELLDVLKKYNVKATFFVTGAGDDALIAREYNEGHAVGLHTASHNYAQIYQNVEAYFADLYAVQERVRRITGQTSYLMRFPGGSSNLVSAAYDGGAHIMSQLVAEVERRGFTYFDWNVASGDAGQTTLSDAIYENVVSRLVEDGASVVLQHDIKGFSVAAVERIIQYGLAQGYIFASLDSSAFTAHHGVNN